MLVVNASNRAKDLAWCRKVAEGKDTKIEDISDQYSLLALQGPKAELILSKLTDVDLSELAPFHFLQTEVTGRPCILSRTGYTGEDGFELYLKGEKAKGLFAEIIAAGKEDGLVPAGLAARDTLRFECKLMLYGNDIDATTSPIEATIGWTVKLEKGSFMGCEVIRDHKDNKPPRRLVGIRMTEKGIPRHGHKIFSTDGEELGFITSGTKSPSLGDFLALGYVKQGFTKIGTELLIEIRNNKKTGKIIKTPFYKKQTS
jgi:aminomethyltransferase